MFAGEVKQAAGTGLVQPPGQAGLDQRGSGRIPNRENFQEWLTWRRDLQKFGLLLSGHRRSIII
jgi:hypothetical protein